MHVYNLFTNVHRNLRLCCVSTTQLTPLPISRSMKDIGAKGEDLNQNSEKFNKGRIEEKGKGKVANDEGGLKDKMNIKLKAVSSQDEGMAVQASRGCVMLHLKELLTSILLDVNDESKSQKEERMIDSLRYQDIEIDGGKDDNRSPTSITISSDNKVEDFDGSINKISIGKSDSFTNGCNEIEKRKNVGIVSGGGEFDIGGIWGGVEGKGAGSCLDQFVLIGLICLSYVYYKLCLVLALFSDSLLPHYCLISRNHFF